MHRARLTMGGVLSVLLAGCGAGGPSEPAASSVGGIGSATPSSEASPSAGASASVAPTATVLAPGVISTHAEEYRVSFSPDGATAYFGRGEGFFPQTQRATIVESHLVDGAWSEASVASFSGEYPDIDPWVSPDGSSLYFSSIRPVDGEARRDADLWRVDRDGESWGEPIHLGAVNSAANELGGSVTADGVLWFASDRGGDWDLYVAEPTPDGFSEPEPVAALNTELWEFNPAVSADGETLLFTSIGREGSSRFGDLFVSLFVDGSWSEAQPLRVNTAADEYHPSLSADGSTLYFVRRAADGDLYEVAWPEADPGP